MLEERTEWALSHPERACAIAANGFAFARARTLESTIADMGPRLRAFLRRTDRSAA